MHPIPYDHALAPLLIRNRLFACMPEHLQSLTVLCIGSNRVNGDSLGPFVGTLLQGLYPERLTVVGSLREPVDALNLKETLQRLAVPADGLLLAVDSIAGTEQYLHQIMVRPGALQPGSGIGTVLPAAGDVSLMGVVMEESENVMRSLSYTSLHVIYEMARAIAGGISLAVRQRFGYEAQAPLLPMR
ncbi:spore protease YyaC [Ectobacillus ponti]|uniref:Spore protease YyaC n=1 Tax=Ectobacillus ponti TaxID=2961894 RepID=A0AA42BNB3_9BACI|nr:spore protease YyaC [Ectobacillus ponti]MCP8967482.1 spore protease YyaC [Ectobacillus ponti]